VTVGKPPSQEPRIKSPFCEGVNAHHTFSLSQLHPTELPFKRHRLTAGRSELPALGTLGTFHDLI
jgi:hypothetical protein